MMQNKNLLKALLPFLYLFILSSTAVLIFREILNKWGVNILALNIGNLVLFTATAVSFILYRSALRNSNPHVILRMVYSALFLKMFICIVAVLVYILAMKKEVNKMAIFGCLVLYCLYTYTEIKIIMRLSRQQKNA
jgi:hypothetical protein